MKNAFFVIFINENSISSQSYRRSSSYYISDFIMNFYISQRYFLGFLQINFLDNKIIVISKYITYLPLNEIIYLKNISKLSNLTGVNYNFFLTCFERGIICVCILWLFILLTDTGSIII